MFGPIAAILLLSGAAVAQAGFDPSTLPAVSGRVAQYSLTARGDVDGLILQDGTEVFLSPALAPSLVQVAGPGDAVVVHGLRARAIPAMQAASITNPATGRSVVDVAGEAPAALPHPPSREMQAAGIIKARLHGPRGDLNGVLLEDGTIVRLPPGEAARIAERLQPGLPFRASGPGTSGPLGRVVAAAEPAAARRPGPASDAPPPPATTGPR